MIRQIGVLVLVLGLILGIINPSFADLRVATKIVAKDASGEYTDIQSAIDALPTGGGLVYIKEGTYEVTTNITIPSQKPVSLKGVNPASTIIRYTGTSSSQGLLKLQGSSTNWIENITVENLTLDCNLLIQYGYWANYLRKATVRNIVVKGHKNISDWGCGIIVGLRDGGITIENCRIIAGSGSSTSIGGIWITNRDDGDSRILVTGNFVEDQNVGIFIEDRANRVIVTKNFVKDCQEGIRTAGTTSCEFLVIEGNHILNTSNNGIHIGDKAQYVNVTSNLIEGGGYGIFARDLSNVTIGNNTIKGGSQRGIHLESGAEVVIEGNSILNTNGDGIGVLDGCKTVSVNSNTVVGSGSMGIRVHNIGGGTAPSNTVVTGNNVKNSARLSSGSSGIYMGNATDCIVGNNRSYDDQATKTQEYGIQEAGSSNYNIIVGNDARGNKTGGITTVGANDVIANNLQ